MLHGRRTRCAGGQGGAPLLPVPRRQPVGHPRACRDRTVGRGGGHGVWGLHGVDGGRGTLRCGAVRSSAGPGARGGKAVLRCCRSRAGSLAGRGAGRGWRGWRGWRGRAQALGVGGVAAWLAGTAWAEGAGPSVAEQGGRWQPGRRGGALRGARCAGGQDRAPLLPVPRRQPGRAGRWAWVAWVAWVGTGAGCGWRGGVAGGHGVGGGRGTLRCGAGGGSAGPGARGGQGGALLLPAPRRQPVGRVLVVESVI